MGAAQVAGGVTLPPVGLWAGWLAGVPASEERRLVRAWEAAGAAVLWISEAFGKEALTHAATILAATEHTLVATGVAVIHARDAVAAAAGARTLAEAWPGRFLLGLGVSHPEMLVRRGASYGGPLDAMRAYLDAMDAARWTGPEVAAPPRLLAALGDGMLRLGAERADGVHPYLVTPEHTAHARAVIGSGPLLAPEQAAVVAADPGTARAAAREHLAVYLALGNYRRSLRRQGFAEDDLDGGGSDRLVDALVAWGTAEHVADRVAAHHAAGADHVAVHLLPASAHTDRVQDAAEVLAAVAGRAPGGSSA